MDLLRFTTAGSVDDGKSTLIGRLLYDSKSIFEDQLQAIEETSRKKGDEYTNLALLTDGLSAEREQGITIDVAYRYFTTPKRKFIIADTPGHIQYTRNMVTGASTANLAIILVDARKGVIEQTCRHAYIAAMLQIKHIVLAVNKMDLVNFDESTFEHIRAQFQAFSAHLDVPDIHYIPISALYGDNVVRKSEKMLWYEGATLLYTLETIHVLGDENQSDQRFPIQWVVRPQSSQFPDYRGYAGRIAGGIFKPGDQITVLPSGLKSQIKSIDLYQEQLQEAYPPMSVTLTLTDDIDISRGDMIVGAENHPHSGKEITCRVCWLNPKPLQVGGKYILKHTTKEARCIITELTNKIDINTHREILDDKIMNMNEVGSIKIKTSTPLFYDSYHRNRTTGSLILIDESTNETVGAGMII